MYEKPTEPIKYSLIEEWYKLASVKFELIRFLFNREFSLLVPNYITNPEIKKCSVRNLKVHSVQHLDFNLKATKMFIKQIPYNFYYSMARYKNGIPNQTLNFLERDNTEWNKNCFKEMISYDFLIDIDADDFNDMQFAYENAYNVKELFDELNVPYELRYSGMGFHFIIPYKYLPKNLTFNPDEENNLYQFLSKLTECLYNKCGELIDLNICDHRRVCKIPYSIALYDNDAFICSSILNNVEFENFKIVNYRLGKYPFEIKNRGTYIFNETGNLSLLLLKFKLNKYIKFLEEKNKIKEV